MFGARARSFFEELYLKWTSGSWAGLLSLHLLVEAGMEIMSYFQWLW